MNMISILAAIPKFRFEIGMSEDDDVKGFIEKNYTKEEITYLAGTYHVVDKIEVEEPNKEIYINKYHYRQHNEIKEIKITYKDTICTASGKEAKKWLDNVNQLCLLAEARNENPFNNNMVVWNINKNR